MRVLAAAGLLSACFSASAWDPSGTWFNLDPNTGQTHHIVINGLTIHGFGQCTPDPCDWGTTPLTKLVATHDRGNEDRVEYLALWDFGFKFTAMMISRHPENPDYLIVKTYDLYSYKGDPRQDRYTIEYLKKSSP